jgi:hypothetical protein
MGLSALLLGATLTAASAQNRNSPPEPSPYKWCLEENIGGAGGGSLPWLCRFKTLEQCQASRNSPADRCAPNNTGQRS